MKNIKTCKDINGLLYDNLCYELDKSDNIKKDKNFMTSQVYSRNSSWFNIWKSNNSSTFIKENHINILIDAETAREKFNICSW